MRFGPPRNVRRNQRAIAWAFAEPREPAALVLMRAMWAEVLRLESGA